MDIRLSRLRTFSGDIDRINYKNKDPFGDFELYQTNRLNHLNYYSMYLEQEIKG